MGRPPWQCTVSLWCSICERADGKLVSKILLCFGEIELVDQVIFASAVLLEFAD